MIIELSAELIDSVFSEPPAFAYISTATANYSFGIYSKINSFCMFFSGECHSKQSEVRVACWNNNTGTEVCLIFGIDF